MSKDNKKMYQVHSDERGGDVTKMKSTLPFRLSVNSRDATGRTPLMDAVLDGNFQGVKSLIKGGADPSLMDNTGLNSLHFAAVGGDTGIISLIQTHVPNIEVRSTHGLTPLMLAAVTGKLHAVIWFLEKGAAATCEDNRGWNSLHFAAEGGDSEVISLIHTHVLDIDSRSRDGLTPLMLAAANSKLHAVKRFLEKGAAASCEDNRGWSSLHHAAVAGDPQVISLIHTHVSGIDSKSHDGLTPLMLAAVTGKLHAVIWFLEKGANATNEDNSGRNTLHYAAEGGHPGVISFIHTYVPDIDSRSYDGLTPLMLAAVTGKLLAARWFLKKGAAATCEDNKGWNSLHFAAEGGDSEVISLIHTHVLDIDSRSRDGLTPLMLAAANSKLHAVKRFLEKGAAASCEDNRGWSSLHHAAVAGDPQVISLIHTHVSGIDSKSHDGLTPLMLAAVTGKLHAVIWFLEKGANATNEDNSGRNTLHYAAEGGHPGVISFIHTYVPDIDSRSHDGLTPLMLAAVTGKLLAVRWFLEKGAAATYEDNRGWNSLHFAAEGGDPEVISLIHTHVLDIDSRSRDGLTPLMLAAANSKLHAVKRFLEKGAAASCEDNRGWSSLHHAAVAGDPQVISLIHTHVSGIDSRSHDWFTPLMLAAANGKSHAVNWFLENGANAICKEKEGGRKLVILCCRGRRP